VRNSCYPDQTIRVRKKSVVPVAKDWTVTEQAERELLKIVLRVLSGSLHVSQRLLCMQVQTNHNSAQ
jgi:hypothetical protein